MKLDWIIGLVSLLALSNAAGTVIFSDGFDYPTPGILSDQSGGNGFAENGWTTPTPQPGAGPASDIRLTPDTYDYSVEGGGVIRGGTAGVEIHCGPQLLGVVRTISIRTLATPFDGDEIYIRFVCRQTAGSESAKETPNPNQLLFLSGNGKNAMLGPSGGYYADSDGYHMHHDFLLKTDGGSIAYGTTHLLPNETTLVVLRFYKSVPGAFGLFDQANLWVNPAYDEADKPKLKCKLDPNGPNAVSSFDTIGFANVISEADSVFYLDSLAAGTTWADVVPSAASKP